MHSVLCLITLLAGLTTSACIHIRANAFGFWQFTCCWRDKKDAQDNEDRTHPRSLVTCCCMHCEQHVSQTSPATPPTARAPGTLHLCSGWSPRHIVMMWRRRATARKLDVETNTSDRPTDTATAPAPTRQAWARTPKHPSQNRRVTLASQGGVFGYLLNVRRFSVESSFQGISLIPGFTIITHYWFMFVLWLEG